jgi:hypothetical protein
MKERDRVIGARGRASGSSDEAIDGATMTNPRQKALAFYGPTKLERLMAVKRRDDLDNLFRINHSIPPGATG